MPKSGKATCHYCPSDDPEWKTFVAIQTYSYLCCQSFISLPEAGITRGFVRVANEWWTRFQ